VSEHNASSDPQPVSTPSAPVQRAEISPPSAVELAYRYHCPPAPHPAALRERGIEGAVLLRVRVDVHGRAADVRLLAGSGWRLLDEAAVRQARICRFTPATQDGQPVDSWVEFPVRFALTS
jgi:periplasmic protein TonB